ncbi:MULTISPECIES: DNA topoisomerase IV subunit A [Aneurinibacillus]|uniref:DNA topoisomerase (ATP-hydrolyzing) n=1 Tax=Aneurinibacillus thermoaerophilus TaxID=143495 RepID=A0A1G7X9R0_ANETH|nr:MULTISPECIES: DNA topoisomerase IV subunit A [Aneurinibacillus]MED0678307.1 DNA topoisomerase IV subunit A [Aneurinibacillus thermoaerophilus]MED0736167.1 DNA topoisomerase IV subunit A [Aneurinibacillus thermoaerophilus]MED0757013.1 DNA topoisomerase IV subunit A [Aneurinibacillus thermoaerophilus]MED0761682.1 DNA topoisomerase IV subunit A [Aneurinibacillus thermoaerophilus]MED0765820.1 DNA topoisomerase IV subunit A [Aneurinibacillus thermoaerophilus]
MSLPHEEYLQMSVRDVYRSRFSDYARYIILSRAIPDVRDGLKPVQRRVLYSMYKEKNTPDRPYRKSAKTVGDVMGNYHPHGDSSIYETMVNLVQPHKMREPLIDGHGHWGTVDGDTAAAMRYTEARLMPIAMEMLRDIEKDTVDFIPNYDNTSKEPTVLPARFPNLLVNGVTGISIGFATEIPTHNLREVINGTIALLHNPDISLDELMKYIPGPDLPGGGIIQGREEIKKAYETGAGRMIIRSRTHMENGKQGRKLIVVDEIPYTVKKKALVTQIEEEIIEKNVDGLLEVRDETDREGMRIVLEVRKDADVDGILHYLFKKTDLQISYSFNMLVIADERPQQLGLKGILGAYIAHQKEVITRRTTHDLEKARKRLHIVEGIIKAISILRQVIDTIMDSDGREDARNRLMANFAFTYEQAEAILDIRLHQLTRLDIKRYEKEEKDLNKKISALEGILKSEKKLNKVLEKELSEIRDKYGDDRRTTLEDEIENLEVDISVTVPAEEVIVTITEEQYIKRTSLRSFNSSGASIETAGVKESDTIRYFFRTNTIHHLLLFTNDGYFYQIPVHEIPDGRWKDIGTSLVNVLPLSKEQKIVAAYKVDSLDRVADESFAFVTEGGMIKRTKGEEYSKTQKKRGIVAVKLKDDDKIETVHMCGEEDEFLLVSSGGMAIRFPVAEVPLTGRNTAGVRGMKLEEGERVVASFVVKPEAEDVLQIITKEGVIKRTFVTQFTTQGRSGKGVLVIRRRKVQPHEVKVAFLEGEMKHGLLGRTDKGREVRIDWEAYCKHLSVNDQGSVGRTMVQLDPGEEVASILFTARAEEKQAGEGVDSCSE